MIPYNGGCTCTARVNCFFSLVEGFCTLAYLTLCSPGAWRSPTFQRWTVLLVTSPLDPELVFKMSDLPDHRLLEYREEEAVGIAAWKSRESGN